MNSVRLQFQTNHRSSQKQPFTPKEDEELMIGLKKAWMDQLDKYFKRQNFDIF